MRQDIEPSSQIRRNELISYVLHQNRDYGQYSCSLDVAIRMLDLAGDDIEIADGVVDWRLRKRATSEAERVQAHALVNELIAKLRASGNPFMLIHHIHGETKVHATWFDSTLGCIAEHLAIDVTEFYGD